MPLPFSQHAETYLQRVAEELDVPRARYEAARQSYHSVGAWLERPESSLNQCDPEVYIQGSFRLGTAIRPVNEAEDYDVDLVCELSLSKYSISQRALKEKLAVELNLYTEAHKLSPPEESRRCWTLNYADDAQFHLDALPAIPDAEGKRLLLESSGLSSDWTKTALAITDIEHPCYQLIGQRWPHSNPKGFTEWFRSRMREVFDAKRNAIALMEKASIEDIPSYLVKTPLQAAVQILKRHRDLLFSTQPDDKPISIIITTLAGLSYESEASVGAALAAILERMDKHIAIRAGVPWIPNPTDPLENFADRWQKYPKRYEAFRAWLSAARRDFLLLSSEKNWDRLSEVAKPIAGDVVAKRAGIRPSLLKGQLSPISLFKAARGVLFAGHKKPVPWTHVKQGSVSIERAIISRKGFRPQSFISNGETLPKNASLDFRARTTVSEPYDVYWQVVNTGTEAAAAGKLRGGFDAGTVERGTIRKAENTSYTGSHTIECFIVKKGYLVARSGAFIVNIA